MRPASAFPGTICGAALLLAACAERPVAVSPLFETQSRWETAAHWQDLAERAADGLVGAAERGFDGRPFHIRVAGTDAPFGQAFGDFLASALVARGAAVSPHPVPGTVIVHAAAQPIARDPRTLRSVPGIATAAGIAALGGAYVVDSWPSPPAAAALGGLTLLLDSTLMSQPTSEVVVTVSVMDDSRYLYRLSESFYVRPVNLRDYVSAEPPPAPLASSAPAAAAPMPLRRLAVVGPAEDRP